jgi:sugar lactone lactonase YvrE
VNNYHTEELFRGLLTIQSWEITMKRLARFVHAALILALSCMLLACNGGGGAATTAVTPNPVTPTLALLAGNTGGGGNSDGTIAAARFLAPNSVAADSAGNVYVADTGNHTIRKITPGGLVSTLAGTPRISGSTDGSGAEASFYNPSGVATDTAGNIYVADSGNHTIRKITPAGVVSTLAGMPGIPGNADGIGAEARFYNPLGIATDGAENVYVADAWNSAIRKITPTGVVTTLAGTSNTPGVPGIPGSADGMGATASFNGPSGVATDSAGNVYVADTWNSTIRKITPDGMVSTLAGAPMINGGMDGTGAAARFYNPSGVATDSLGNIYVTDSGNHTLRKITANGMVSTLAGFPLIYGSADGLGYGARFNHLTGVATDSSGYIYVADKENNTIRKITPAGMVSTLAGIPMVDGGTDGTGTDASFKSPNGLSTDSSGNIYAADSGNHTIRKITPSGVVITLAGTSNVSGNTDGAGSAASFVYPNSVATDSAGNVYVADTWNHTIRKITPDGMVTTLAGNPGVFGSADGTGAAARFNAPFGIATDSAGNVYVADSNNSTIRKITPVGTVSTLAGTPGITGSADGTGTVASFFSPYAVATDSTGNVYVADTWNHTIRKITPAGMVSTFAGTPGISGSADGNSGAAKFHIPCGIATDNVGNVYVADTWNHTIRKITPAGVVNTVVGVAGKSGFAPGDLPGVLSSPWGVAISGTSLYITTYNGVAVVNNVP